MKTIFNAAAAGDNPKQTETLPKISTAYLQKHAHNTIKNASAETFTCDNPERTKTHSKISTAYKYGYLQKHAHYTNKKDSAETSV